MKISKTIFSTILMLFMLVFNSGAFNGPAVPVEPDPTPSTPPPNPGFSLSMSGGSTVTEGNSLIFTITSSDATVINPQWTVTRIGSPTAVIKEPTKTVSGSGLQADVVFYWYPGNNPGLYKVEFSCENPGYVCSEDKTVTVSFPSPCGRVRAYQHLIFDFDCVQEDGVIKYFFTGEVNEAYYTCELPFENNIPENSEFHNKVDKHEQQHVQDLDGINAPVVEVILADALDQVKTLKNVIYSSENILIIKKALSDNVYANMLPWTEARAYSVSNKENPPYLNNSIGDTIERIED